MKYVKSYIIFIVMLLISTVIFSSFNYFDILKENICLFIILFIILVSSFISGFYIGFNTSNKGYLEGLKQGLINISLLLFLTIIFGKFKLISIFYYFLIIGITTLGSIVGINQKGKNK